MNETLEPTPDQERLIRNFYQEDFEDPSNPIGTPLKRKMVKSERVHAGIARVQESGLNPSDAKSLLEFAHSTYSGYVHGVYIRIMELFDAPLSAEGEADTAAGDYRLTGGVQGPRMDFIARAFLSGVMAGFLTTRIVAKMIPDNEIDALLTPMFAKLAAISTTTVEPNAAMERIKRGLPPFR